MINANPKKTKKPPKSKECCGVIVHDLDLDLVLVDFFCVRFLNMVQVVLLQIYEDSPQYTRHDLIKVARVCGYK